MQHAIDETGKHYGKITVIERAGNIGATAAWLCRCDCGNLFRTRGASLRRTYHKTISCGHCRRWSEKVKNEVGNRYGKLFVIERVFDERKKAMWLCQCDCGNTKIIAGVDLRTSTKSCGCLAKLPNGEGAYNSLYRRIRDAAHKRNIEFDLTKEQVRKITSQNCFYCGTSPKQADKATRNNGQYFYNGIDRVDNNLGYIITNVVPACGTCNYAKHTLTVNEFRDWVIHIYKHWANHPNLIPTINNFTPV